MGQTLSRECTTNLALDPRQRVWGCGPHNPRPCGDDQVSMLRVTPSSARGADRGGIRYAGMSPRAII